MAIIELKKASSDPKYGHDPEKRPVEDLLQSGVIVVNKPKGPTSHQVSAYVQRILGIEKAGHSGTLDPGVTGVLPVALGPSTRVLEVLLKSGKEYVCIMRLHGDISAGKMYHVAEEMTGRIRQLPPVRSAIKRQWREREVYEAEIVEVDGRDVLFRMSCQAGTYVRKWCHDFGKKAGVGAHMAELIRTRAGPFTADVMVSLQDVDDAVWYWREEKNESLLRHCVLPVERAIELLPKVWILDTAVDSVCHGALVAVPAVARIEDEIVKDDLVAVLSLKGELVAIGVAKMSAVDVVKAERGYAVKVDKVFLRPGTYPKFPRV